MNIQPVLKRYSFDFKDRTPAADRRRRMVLTQRSRHIVQLAFAIFIIAGSITHFLSSAHGVATCVRWAASSAC